MKMKNKIIILTLTLVLSACGSKIKKDYIITDASVEKQPSWVKKMVYKTKKNEYKYFISRAENVNQRLCEKGAEARAKIVVAGEIATEIENNYNEVIKSKDLKASESVTNNLKEVVSMYLAGVEVEEKYWEKRNYKVSLGAENDVNKYSCFVLVKMNKNNYDKAVNLSLDRMFDKIRNKTMDKNTKDEVKEEIKNKILDNE